MPVPAADAIVIGGGLIGLLTARELAASGLQVTVLDQAAGSPSASWAAGGILSPLRPWQEPPALQPLADWSLAAYPPLVQALQTQTGVDTGFVCSGMLVVGECDTDAEQWAAQHGHELEWLDRAGIDRVQPGLGPVCKQACWLPDIAQVRNPRLLTALRRGLQHQGVTLRAPCRVASLDIRDQRCKGVVLEDGETLAADFVVLCAGAWSSRLLPAPGTLVRPMRGQMLAWSGTPAMLQRIVLLDGYYLIPRQDGLILGGSTVEDVGFDQGTTTTAAAAIAAAAGKMLPALKGQPHAWHWAGLRPATADGLPMIGACPGVAKLYLNTGHFRNGVLLAPGSARLLADLLLGRELILPAAPYSPDRK